MSHFNPSKRILRNERLNISIDKIVHCTAAKSENTKQKALKFSIKHKKYLVRLPGPKFKFTPQNAKKVGNVSILFCDDFEDCWVQSKCYLLFERKVFVFCRIKSDQIRQCVMGFAYQTAELDSQKITTINDIPIETASNSSFFSIPHKIMDCLVLVLRHLVQNVCTVLNREIVINHHHECVWYKTYHQRTYARYVNKIS